MSQVRVDHIIYAVDDLESAGRQLYEESGLASIEGGRHLAWGTANRIVPLGTAYVELITVVDRDVAAFSDFGRPVMDAIAARRYLVGWVVATDAVRRRRAGAVRGRDRYRSARDRASIGRHCPLARRETSPRDARGACSRRPVFVRRGGEP